MRYPQRRVSLAALSIGALVALMLATSATAATQVASAASLVTPNSQRFLFNNSTQYFTVPGGVHQVHLAAFGGSGGAGGYRSGLFATPGGLGAELNLDAPVNPGDILVIEVGGQGGNAAGQSAGVGGNSSGSGQNGGPGGNVNSGVDGTAGGGGGGGTTVVDASNPGTPLLVAGGGGGGGGGGAIAGYNGGAGGNGGNAAGGCDTELGAGEYGSGLTGGAGGTCGQTGSPPGGLSGSGETPASGAGTGGGGGGGYNGSSGGQPGGSLGGGGGGGGAGVSFASPAASHVQVYNGDPGNGQVLVSWSTLPPAGIPQSASFSCCTAKTFTVPAGVTQVSIDAWGGSGGNGGASASGLFPSRGGFGAAIREIVPVTPGDVLAVGSGGQGGTGDFVGDDATSVPVQGGSAMLNSSSEPGGDGGSIDGNYANAGGSGGAGGGGTVVTDKTTNSVLLEAGGGGGGGGASAQGDGDNGGTGGNAGSPVVTGNSADGDGYYGSGGSTPGYANGVGGLFMSASGPSGETAADRSYTGNGGTGGGGGGGTIGGTAGQLCTGSSCNGSGGGGGAGSSMWTASAQDVMVSNSRGGVGGATISWVARGATSTTISASPNPATAGAPVTFKATVADPGAPAGYAPTGNVTFIDYATGLAIGLPVTLSSTAPYTATLTTTLPAGSTQVYAYYSGDSDFVPSASSKLTENVTPALSLSGDIPAVIAQGAKSLPVTITGAGFSSGATLSASNAGITFSSVIVKSATTLTAKETATAGVPVGSYDLTVNQGNLSATCTRCVKVVAQPTAISFSPSSLGQGASAVVAKVVGTGFVAPAKVTFTGPSSGVHATVTSTSATSLTIKAGVSPTAAPGAYTLKVSGGDGGTATCTGCLNVITGPAVTAISPTTVAPGQKTTVTVTGSGFSSDAKLTGPHGVSFSGVTVNTGGRVITATMTVASTAPSGAGLPVTVKNGPLGGYGSTTRNALTIT